MRWDESLLMVKYELLIWITVFNGVSYKNTDVEIECFPMQNNFGLWKARYKVTTSSWIRPVFMGGQSVSVSVSVTWPVSFFAP